MCVVEYMVIHVMTLLMILQSSIRYAHLGVSLKMTNDILDTLGCLILSLKVGLNEAHVLCHFIPISNRLSISLGRPWLE